MKPEDLKSPFTWDKRCVMIHDRVWYVPSHYTQYESFAFPGWEHSDLFLQNQPIKIEYCSGNGAWIANKAIQEPHVNWIAVEKKFERVRKIWSKLKNHRLNNLLVVCGEAETVTEHYFPNSSVAEVFINFPDPWPKKRHAKHRIVQLPFVNEMYRILQTEGILTLVTDDPNYSDLMIEVLAQHEGFESIYPAPYFVTESSNYGSSYFEQLWREKGRMIRYHQFRKK